MEQHTRFVETLLVVVVVRTVVEMEVVKTELETAVESGVVTAVTGEETVMVTEVVTKQHLLQQRQCCLPPHPHWVFPVDTKIL